MGLLETEPTRWARGTRPEGWVTVDGEVRLMFITPRRFLFLSLSPDLEPVPLPQAFPVGLWGFDDPEVARCPASVPALMVDASGFCLGRASFSDGSMRMQPGSAVAILKRQGRHDVETLRTRLDEWRAQHCTRRLVIAAADAVSLELVVEVLDAVRGVGLEDVLLTTDRDERCPTVGPHLDPPGKATSSEETGATCGAVLPRVGCQQATVSWPQGLR